MASPAVVVALGDFEHEAPALYHRVEAITGLSAGAARATPPAFILDRIDGRLCLVDTTGASHSPLVVDFDRSRRRFAGGDLLRRAVGRANSTVIDATAGFGEDTVHLARCGYSVIAVERCPVIAALLIDGLERLRDPALRQSVRVVVGDSIDLLAQLDGDVVYLDPMYSTAGRGRSLPRRRMVVARLLAGDDGDAGATLAKARARFHRVVVKRPDKAPPLAAGVHHAHVGKTVRYDVYIDAGAGGRRTLRESGGDGAGRAVA